MTPTLDELKNNPDYTLIKELPHTQITEFVFNYIKKKNSVMNSFYIFHSILFVFLLYFLIQNIINSLYPWNHIFWAFVIALVTGFTIIIPLHEGIHAIIFKLLGAKNIRFGADVKKMIFYATADKYVTNRKKFILVALAPFTAIIIGCTLYAFIVGRHAIFFALFFMIIHGMMCIGDFALMSFYAENKGKKIYTFDDTQNKISYFYQYTGSVPRS
jgi:hypothetical protein